eukprot:scaffold2943_cov239-Pinguiococcus_pyrenoidosus.AAC.2
MNFPTPETNGQQGLVRNSQGKVVSGSLLLLVVIPLTGGAVQVPGATRGRGVGRTVRKPPDG